MLILLLASYHVLVEKLPDPDLWTITGIIASAAVAVLTGFLALQTKRLADKTTSLAEKTGVMASETHRLAEETRATIDMGRAESAYNERHHQESLSPAVLLSEPRVVFEKAESGIGGPQQFSGYIYTFVLYAAGIRNVGFGPALNLNAEVRISGLPLTGFAFFQSFGAGESRDDFNVKVHMWNEQVLTVPSGAHKCTILLTYANIFEQLRVTTYEIDLESESGAAKSVVKKETVDAQRIASRPPSEA